MSSAVCSRKRRSWETISMPARERRRKPSSHSIASGSRGFVGSSSSSRAASCSRSLASARRRRCPPRRPRQPPCRRGDVARERLEQARLPAAVGPDDPKTLPRLDLEGQLAEHLGGAVHEFEPVDAKQRHGTESLPAYFREKTWD